MRHLGRFGFNGYMLTFGATMDLILSLLWLLIKALTAPTITDLIILYIMVIYITGSATSQLSGYIVLVHHC